ncbi:hypothetical protein FA95DRAFT_1619493 [Auriscalpium vulgare]|uniref:Uncharacterized protein n=1 Tax=Auriscalpium vulgare TaxID=40419 RepID=A0ACB8R1I3_9AGAM|nr:hypothetical protein FA95DRAFT_1619493 [Auriscalpium vulgare]
MPKFGCFSAKRLARRISGTSTSEQAPLNSARLFYRYGPHPFTLEVKTSHRNLAGRLHATMVFHVEQSYPSSRLPQPVPTLPDSWTGYAQDSSHPVRWWEARANIWDAYLATVHDLLAQPNTRMFLHMGGLAWRLAVQFGSPSLLKDAARGPSRLVTDYGIGEATTDPVPSHVDSGSKADFDRLFGMKSGQSLWPRQKDFLDSRAWNALLSVKRDDNLTPNQWSRELRDSLHPAERRALNGPGSEVHAESKINADPDITALGILNLGALQSSWDISVSASSAETGGAL